MARFCEITLTWEIFKFSGVCSWLAAGQPGYRNSSLVLSFARGSVVPKETFDGE